MTAEEKEKIDYEIKAKREARDEDVADCVIAIFIICVSFLLGIYISNEFLM